MLRLLSSQLQLRGEVVAAEIQTFNQETGDLDRVLSFPRGVQTHTTYLPGESCRNEAVGYLREQKESKYVKLFAYSACILPLWVKTRSQTGLQVLSLAFIWARRACVVFDLKYRNHLQRRDTENPPALFKSWPSVYGTKPLFHLPQEFQCWRRKGQRNGI